MSDSQHSMVIVFEKKCSKGLKLGIMITVLNLKNIWSELSEKADDREVYDAKASERNKLLFVLLRLIRILLFLY